MALRERRLAVCILLLLGWPGALYAKYYAYIGDVGPNHVLIAWGSTDGDNTIGRNSKPHGKAVVRINNQEIAVADRNWVIVRDLAPDTEYPYEVLLAGRKLGASKVRTWPERAERLRFFVIGDFGSGDSSQRRVAEAMVKEFERLQGDNPPRFILTTGDNIYGRFGFTLRYRDTGDKDGEWDAKFFSPYERIIARIPFFASLGNHDGNESEGRQDLAQYLDNFFFPGGQPARYYRFNYGGFADFFGLDTTTNAEEGPPRPVFLENGDQHKWLQKNLAEARVPWKIVYMHHPPFNAGPRHPAVARELAHFLKAFQGNGVRVVFTGHEHNFQFSEMSRETGNIRYIVSGAGGELRTSSVQSSMASARIDGWAPQLHFLSVEIEGKEMRVTPVSFAPVNVIDRRGGKVEMPLKIAAP